MLGINFFSSFKPIMDSNYKKQKSHCFAHFKVSKADASKIASGSFNIYDFVNNSFSFSFSKKQLAISVLDSLKRGPKTFKQLQEQLKASKSSLYLVITALNNSGFIESKGKNRPFSLSQGFSQSLASYAAWWETWLRL